MSNRFSIKNRVIIYCTQGWVCTTRSIDLVCCPSIIGAIQSWARLIDLPYELRRCRLPRRRCGHTNRSRWRRVASLAKMQSNSPVRPICRWSTKPAQTVPDDEDHTRYDFAAIDAGDAVRQRQERIDLAHLRIREPKQIVHGCTMLPVNQYSSNNASNLIGREPRSTILSI